MAGYNKKRVGKYLKELRKSKNWSQREMANKLQNKISNITDGDNGKQLISKLENGKTGLTFEIANAYASVFKISLDEVYLRKSYKKNNRNNQIITIEKEDLKAHKVAKRKRSFQEIVSTSLQTNRVIELCMEANKYIWGEN